MKGGLKRKERRGKSEEERVKRDLEIKENGD